VLQVLCRAGSPPNPAGTFRCTRLSGDLCRVRSRRTPSTVSAFCISHTFRVVVSRSPVPLRPAIGVTVSLAGRDSCDYYGHCVTMPEDQRNGLGSGQPLDQRMRYMNRMGAACAPLSLILSDVCGGGGETGPQPVAWHPTGTFSSQTGVPPSRGRLSTQPRDSAVLPTRPPHQVRERREPGRHTRDPARAAEAVRPEPGTALPRNRSCSTPPRAPDFIHTLEIDVTAVA
jgi:hypothetical protein